MFVKYDQKKKNVKSKKLDNRRTEHGETELLDNQKNRSLSYFIIQRQSLREIG